MFSVQICGFPSCVNIGAQRNDCWRAQIIHKTHTNVIQKVNVLIGSRRRRNVRNAVTNTRFEISRNHILCALSFGVLLTTIMSTMSPPSTSSPARQRENGWEESHSAAYQYDYDSIPSNYYGGAVSRAPYPHEYWSYEHRGGGGYWGPPPPYESYPSPERSMPPPARVLRGPAQRSPRSFPTNDDPHPLHVRVPPSPRGTYNRVQVPLVSKRDYRHSSTARSSGAKDKKKGDPLSILANVSAGMTGRDGHHHQTLEKRHNLSAPAPTSPLQRRNGPSPITPSQTPPESKHRVPRHQVTPTSASNRSQEPPPAWDLPKDYYSDFSSPRYYPPRRRPIPPRDYGNMGSYEGTSSVLVERGSFDSQGDLDSHYHPSSPPRGYYYDDHPSPYGYWDAPAHPTHGPYPSPRWNYYPQEVYPQEYNYENQDEAMNYRRSTTSSIPPHHTAPYTYVQQPRLEEKTILRKKFSWKHYPEVGRSLLSLLCQIYFQCRPNSLCVHTVTA